MTHWAPWVRKTYLWLAINNLSSSSSFKRMQNVLFFWDVGACDVLISELWVCCVSVYDEDLICSIVEFSKWKPQPRRELCIWFPFFIPVIFMECKFHLWTFVSALDSFSPLKIHIIIMILISNAQSFSLNPIAHCLIVLQTRLQTKQKQIFIHHVPGEDGKSWCSDSLWQ